MTDFDAHDSIHQREPIMHAFYHMLAHNGSGKRQHATSLVNLPDTVLYSYSKPLDWCFTTKDGRIERREASMVNSRTIAQSLEKMSKAKSGIKAWYLQPNDDGNLDVSCTGKEGLLQFLQEEKGTGVLQHFIDGKGDGGGVLKNSIVQCTWSPRAFFMEKITGKYPLLDRDIPMDKRCSLDPLYITTTTFPLMSPNVAGAFHIICEDIVNHFSVVFGYNISSLVINCKVDNAGKVWVLWCSRLTCTAQGRGRSLYTLTLKSTNVQQDASRGQDGYVNKLREAMGIDEHGDDISSSSAVSSVARRRHKKESPDALTEVQACIMCTEAYRRRDMSKIQKKWLLFALSALDSNEQARDYRVEGDDVPSSVLLLHPRILPSEFHRVKNQSWWLNETVLLCDKCLGSLSRATARMTASECSGPAWLAHEDEIIHGRHKAASIDFSDGWAPSVHSTPRAMKSPTHKHTRQSVPKSSEEELLMRFYNTDDPTFFAVRKPPSAAAESEGTKKPSRGGAFMPASKAHLDAADIYEYRDGYAVRVGFGRPVPQLDVPKNRVTPEGSVIESNSGKTLMSPRERVVFDALLCQLAQDKEHGHKDFVPAYISLDDRTTTKQEFYYPENPPTTPSTFL